MINNKEKNFISIVAYFYNNPQSCLNFFKAVEDSRIFSDHFENYEIIIVNDGSDPKKLDEIKNGLKTNCHFKQINFVNMSKYQGIEAAINAGNDFAIGDFIYEFDTLEINYDIDLIFQVYEKALEGFDIVSAVPNKTEKLSSAFCLEEWVKENIKDYHILRLPALYGKNLKKNFIPNYSQR